MRPFTKGPKRESTSSRGDQLRIMFLLTLEKNHKEKTFNLMIG